MWAPNDVTTKRILEKENFLPLFFFAASPSPSALTHMYSLGLWHISCHAWFLHFACQVPDYISDKYGQWERMSRYFFIRIINLNSIITSEATRRKVVSALYVGNMTILLSQFIRVRDIRYALILHICQLWREPMHNCSSFCSNTEEVCQWIFLKVSEMRFCYSNRVSTCHRSTAAERCALSKLGSMRIFHS